MAQAAEVRRQDAFRFLQAWRLQRSAGASLVTAGSSWSPTMGLLLGTVMPASCAVAVWEGRRAVALAQMARQSGRDQWDVMHLVVAGLREHASAETGAVSARLLLLLDEVCRIAGTKRITGIVARVSEQSWLVALFRRAGFSVTMREHVFSQSAPFAAAAPDVPGLRLQQKRDAWALHQLYLRSTPQSVRLAEGRTARDWQLRRGSTRLSFQAARWVVENEDGMTGWLTEAPGRSGELRVQIGVAPGCGALARDLVATALGRARERGSASIRSRAPAYMTDARQAFLDCGFAETERDLVLRRSLAVRARYLAPARSKRGVARSGLTATQSRALAAQESLARPGGSGETGPRGREC